MSTSPKPYDRMEQELADLIRVTTDLQARVREMRQTAYYHQSNDRALALVRQLHKARSHAELSLEALRVPGHIESDPPEEPFVDGSWLGTKLRRLTEYLTGAGESEQNAAPTRDGGFEGDSWTIPLPDLLGFLQVQCKTGILRVYHPTERICIEFEGGELVHAYSDNSPEGYRLGEILVRHGAIAEEGLRAILESSGKSRRLLGERLTRGEIVSHRELARAAEEQVQSLFHRLFGMQDTHFSFREGLPANEMRSRFNVTHLLLESARHMDEKGAA